MVIERINKIIDNQGISVNAFEKKIGASEGVIRRAIKNNTDIQSKWLSSISDNYPKINTSWLLTGNGSMETSSPVINSDKGVPYYDVDFIGGFDLVMNDQSMKPNFYIDFSPFNDADYWVNITGKSMSPFISHGDLVALQRFDGWQEFVLYGEIYAIVTDNFRTIKIVGKGEDKKHLSLIPYSKSPEFSQQDIPKRLIQHMFKVKGSIKKFF